MDDIRLLQKPMSKEESYMQRRQLFKNIWETALQIDDKEDILKKPKIIKTLRMDEIDKCPVGRSKKQRIKNLRHVCKRILDFCDQQDADEKFDEQFSADNKSGSKEAKPKKVKRKPKKIQKTNSLLAPSSTNITVARVSLSEKKNLQKPQKEIWYVNKPAVIPQTLNKLQKPTITIVKKKPPGKQKIRTTKQYDTLEDAPTASAPKRRDARKERTIKKKRHPSIRDIVLQ